MQTRIYENFGHGSRKAALAVHIKYNKAHGQRPGTEKKDPVRCAAEAVCPGSFGKRAKGSRGREITKALLLQTDRQTGTCVRTDTDKNKRKNFLSLKTEQNHKRDGNDLPMLCSLCVPAMSLAHACSCWWSIPMHAKPCICQSSKSLVKPQAQVASGEHQH